MALDQSYLDQIKGFEGYSDQPYWDYKQSTSGYGTKAQPGDENIPADQRQGVYEQRFQDEVGKAASSVDSFAPNLPPGVRAALTSLTYNAGPAWQQSGLGEAIKSGNYDKARGLFLQYNKAGGEVNPGLVARRQKEAAWFDGGGQPASASPAGTPSTPSVASMPQQKPPMLPQQQPPVLPQQVAAAPQGAAPGLFSQIPAQQAPQAPPIYYAPRRQIDLSALRAALQRPIFSQG